MKTPILIKIDGDIFNVNNIQALSYEDKKNELGNDSEYICFIST